MIKLVNGRGMLGSALARRMSEHDIDCTIYHTWDITDKSAKRQSECYNSFVEYVDSHTSEYIVFISTDTHKYSDYMAQKLNAEHYLLNKQGMNKAKVIRLPLIIGNGIFNSIRSGKIIDFSNKYMTMCTIGEAVDFIYHSIWNSTKIDVLEGHKVDSYLVHELIQYGAGNA